MITKTQVVEFVKSYGDCYNVTIADLRFVGINQVLIGVNSQVNPRASVMRNGVLYPVQDTDPEQILNDFFSESFSHLYDVAYINQNKMSNH